MNNLNPSLPCPHCHARSKADWLKVWPQSKNVLPAIKKVKFKKTACWRIFQSFAETFRYFCSSCLHRSGNTDQPVWYIPPIYQYGISYRLFSSTTLSRFKTNFHLLKKTNKHILCPSNPLFRMGNTLYGPIKNNEIVPIFFVRIAPIRFEVVHSKD